VASRLKPAAAAWEQADPADPILINMGISLRSLALPTLGRKSFLRSDDRHEIIHVSQGLLRYVR